MRNSTLGYLEKDGAYLMLHRVKKKHDINHDKWIGVGGGFEEGESPEDCMRREAYEETGLRLGKLAYRGLVTFVCYTETAIFQIPLPSLQCVDGIPIVTEVMWQPLSVSAMVWRALIMIAGENQCMTCWSAPV